MQALADDEAPMMEAQVIVASKLLEGRMEACDDRGAPVKAGREMEEQRGSDRIGGVSGCPGSRGGQRLGGRNEASSDVRGGRGGC